MPEAATIPTQPPRRFGPLTDALQVSPLRAAISAVRRIPEPEIVPQLLAGARLTPEQAAVADALALRIAQPLRAGGRSAGRAGLVQNLLQEFALSSQEGIALMCLAEALLRIPDSATRDALIRDKLGAGDWSSHLGNSPSLFVNAATWGLLLTGKLVSTSSDAGLSTALRRVLAHGGEPLIRKAMDFGMRMMGEQFVTGETIEQALERAAPRESEGFRHSYDILGEAALTAEEADRYARDYEHAIHAIGKHAAGRGIYDGPGISMKLSALHPRFSRAQVRRAKVELYPRILHLAQLARQYDMGFNIDAEECSRLELTLDLLEQLCFEPSLAGWNGIGFVVQTYQKRCLALVDWLVDLAGRSRRRLMIRLVKGAYWDAEIKRAQIDGLDGYPVFTRKPYSDIAYIACARRLLAAPAEIYPQFATHNAHTVAAVHALAGPSAQGRELEFQCLHGMGEPLYELIAGDTAKGKLGRPCRIYAPVGRHDTLLAYLVRRLLENGSNTSFINRVANDDVPLAELVQDPAKTVDAIAAREGAVGLPHPSIALPEALYGKLRHNSHGIDFTDERHLAALGEALEESARSALRAEPMLAQAAAPEPPIPVLNPADRRDVVGHVRHASVADIETALRGATDFAAAWAATEPADRATALERAADLLQGDALRLVALMVREAGKTGPNAIAEVREAVDFLHYYAAEVRRDFSNATHKPLGPVVCISPWNFPLAIFMGQIAAALAAGNTVLAKPAEQTPLVAAQAVQALWDAGVPRSAVQLLPGDGPAVGGTLVADPRVQGVVFTGSTEVARLLQRSVAGRLNADGRPVPLIAETGGQNAMVVDSSALPEQVVTDVLGSAFDSAGQRCSALRVLCVQRDVADRLMAVLLGAMRELRLGDPRALAVDVGPVIDAQAKAGIDAHLSEMQARGRLVQQPVAVAPELALHGAFVAPTVIELEHLGELRREVFGPVLHVLRYDRSQLDLLCDQINATGYGLTLGVHTRIDETVARVVAGVRAGNVYVNRNMVGAVVGVQPFGGEGLSGTGPKAGGPLYLLRLLSERPADAAARSIAVAGEVARPPIRGLPVAGDADADAGLVALRQWAAAQGRAELAALCARFGAEAPARVWRALAGPTGEANLYTALPREAVLCLADDEADRLAQLAAVLAAGSRAVWPSSAAVLLNEIPEDVRERVSLAQDWRHAGVHFDAVLHHGSTELLREVCAQIAAPSGIIVGVTGLRPGETAIPLERLVVERSLAINTAAAGGNATLMTIG